MKRREFVKKSLMAGGLCACSGLSLLSTGCSPIPLASFQRSGNQVKVDLAIFENQKSCRLELTDLKAPIFVKKVKDGFSAVLMLCTHKACNLRPSGSILSCPCHGSEFDHSGTVLSGPAETDLHRYPTTTENNTLIIQII